MVCPSCGSPTETAGTFCSQCGRALVPACPACGAPAGTGDRFCGECGTRLGSQATIAPGAEAAAVSERRLVSMLFVNLAGSASLAEQRDAEEVRDVLSRYYETARRVIAAYGGTAEDFIGEAVIAVWGTPAAHQDDAERAVRAALELVGAVEALGAEAGSGELTARGAVLTGEAAVTVDARGQEIVAGDLVGTASAMEGMAEPGTVVVAETTRWATAPAIAYADMGVHKLRGRAEPVALWRALRVLGGGGGRLKAAGLEAPFVGRGRELRLVKEFFHACAEERRAHLVCAVGIGGIGKSRLAWEFFKYLDGLADIAWWHQGRCLSYGEGVAYGALAEMVRMRAEIDEGDDPQSARRKLRAALEAHVPDLDELAWVEPRVAHLLGLEDAAAYDREDLFAGWRLFFERLADRFPTVLVFEDMQWADASLLDFVTYLLEWSSRHPIYVLVLARPALGQQHPDFGTGLKTMTTISLEPLGREAMVALLSGLVPGLPGRLVEQILARAEGVPLYAVETVRLLLDRGLLVRDGDAYRPTGPIETLEVPTTLQQLVAERLDALTPRERRLVQDAAVLGETFTTRSLAVLHSSPEPELEPLLRGLVRKEVLELQADPRSPQEGQYSFLQDLVRRVAYETLSRRDRKARHLAAAADLERDRATGESEIAAIVAAHHVAAYEADPAAEDAQLLRARAVELLARAGDRASSLGANDEAHHHFERAAALSDDPLLEADLRERAGGAAWVAGDGDRAEAHLRRAFELYTAAGRAHPAARVSARLGEVEGRAGQIEPSLERMEQAFGVLSRERPDADVAALAAQLGRLHLFAGHSDLATLRIESALELAEALWLPEVLAQALLTASLILSGKGRTEQALALTVHSLGLALEHDLSAAALRAYANASWLLDARDRIEEALDHCRQGLVLARKVGNRNQELRLLADTTHYLERTGCWDDALTAASAIPEQSLAENATLDGAVEGAVQIAAARGEIAEARRVLELIGATRNSDDVTSRACFAGYEATVLLAEGREREALAAAERALAAQEVAGMGDVIAKVAFCKGLESALSLGDLDKVEELVGRIDARAPGHLPPSLRATAARFRAHLAAARGPRDAVEHGFKAAAAIFREYGMPFDLAVTLLDHGRWLAAAGRHDESVPLLADALETFSRLRAQPWIGRVGRLRAEESSLVG